MSPLWVSCCFALLLVLSQGVVSFDAPADDGSWSAVQDSGLFTLLEGVLGFYVPTESKDEKCAAHSRTYVEKALNSTAWALQMMDSSAKIPGGLVRGNTMELGNFDECLNTKPLNDNNYPLFTAQYCMVDVAFNLSKQSVLTPLVGQQFLRWGFCVPSTCGVEDLREHLQSSMNQLLKGTDDLAMVKVSQKNCRTTAKDPPDVGDWITIAVLLALLGLIISATVVDVRTRNETEKRKNPTRGRQALLAFSFYTNFNNLMRLRSGAGTMSSVNGIRFMSIIWVIVGHRYTKEWELPKMNHHEVYEGLAYDWSQMVITSANISVDTFFLLSGMLVSFVFMKHMDVTKKFNLISFYIYRYVRLTPAVALVVLLYSRVLMHLGSGPLWNEVIGQQETNCRNNWWTNLLYINNYVHSRSDEQCVSQTWYLAVDMQFFWFSPLLLYPLWRWPRVGYVLTATVTVLGIFAPTYVTYQNHFPWTSVWNISKEAKMDYFTRLYIVAYNRTPPYLVGIALGVLMYKMRGTKSRLSWMFVWLGWTISTLASLAIIFTVIIYYRTDYEYSPLAAALYAGFHRFGWSLVVSWVIYACEKGHGGPVNAILSWKYWQPLSRLSYTAYLTHMIILLHELGTARSFEYFSHYRTVHKMVGDLFFILIISAIVSLSTEMPILILEKAILRKDEPPKPKAAAVENGTTKSEEKTG